MDEAEKSTLENLDIEKEQNREQLRKAARYWKEKHDTVLATAYDTIVNPKKEVTTEDINPEWKKKLH